MADTEDVILGVMESPKEKSGAALEMSKSASSRGTDKSLYLSEAKCLASLAMPISVASILTLLTGIVDLIFVGRLGEKELAAASLASTCFMLVNHPAVGLTTALDTLFSQAFGANAFQLYSEWLIVGFTAMLAVSVVFCLCLLGVEAFLTAIGIDELLCQMAGGFAIRLIPGVFPLFTFMVLTKYLQSQGILAPSVYIALAANALNVGLNWLFIYQLDLGFNGAPIATSASRWVQLLLMVLYIAAKKKTHEKTWPKTWLISRARFKLLWPKFIILAVPGALMLGLEAWAFEVTTLFAGQLTTQDLDAHTILNNLCGFFFLGGPFALGVGSTIRVGQLLGSGEADRAQTTARVLYLMMAVTMICLALFYVLARFEIGKLFTHSSEIVRLVAHLAPLAALFQMSDGGQCAMAGVLRGMGRQRTVALLNLVGFWIVGLPVGYILTFEAELGVDGLWYGLVAGLTTTMFLSCCITYRIDWTKTSRLTRQKTLSMVVVTPSPGQ